MRITLTLFPLLFIGCLPNRLVPKDFTIEKNNDEAYIALDSISIALRNLSIESDHFVFGMEIQNKASRPIFINTKNIRKYAHHLPYTENKKYKYYQEVLFAMSPEQVNEFFEMKRKNAQAAAAFLFLLGAAITTYDIIKDEKDNSKEHWTEKDEKRATTRDFVTTTSLLATDFLTETAFANEEKAEVELRYLPDELFDREVVYAGETYQGKILFKKFGELQPFHRITCPVEGQNFHFDFRKATVKERKFLYERGY